MGGCAPLLPHFGFVPLCVPGTRTVLVHTVDLLKLALVSLQHSHYILIQPPTRKSTLASKQKVRRAAQSKFSSGSAIFQLQFQQAKIFSPPARWRLYSDTDSSAAITGAEPEAFLKWRLEVRKLERKLLQLPSPSRESETFYVPHAFILIF